MAFLRDVQDSQITKDEGEGVKDDDRRQMRVSQDIFIYHKGNGKPLKKFKK